MPIGGWKGKSEPPFFKLIGEKMTKEKLYRIAFLSEQEACVNALSKLSDAEDKIKELTKLSEHGNGDILLGWMDAHKKAMDKLEQAEKDAKHWESMHYATGLELKTIHDEFRNATKRIKILEDKSNNDAVYSYNKALQYNELADKNYSLLLKYLKCKEVINELLESAEYWSEYDVPVGIVDRMKEAVK